jgi:glycosyltransferase involved in cell wall biosynthesis
VSEITIKKMPGKLFRLLYAAGLAPRLEWLLGIDRVDLVIFPNFYAWPVQTKGARIITCIPDTTYLDVPEYVPHRYFRKLLAAGVKHSVKVSDELIVCSEATAQSLEDHYGRAVSTMTVAYPGYELPQVKPAQSVIYIPKQHIFFVGTLETRKNIANLSCGYVALPQKLRDGTHMLAGGKGWLDEEIGRSSPSTP